jgi:hypothetical protein
MVCLKLNGVEFSAEEVLHVRISENNCEIGLVFVSTPEHKGIDAASAKPAEETELILFGADGQIIFSHTGFSKITKSLTPSIQYGFEEKIALINNEPLF